MLSQLPMPACDIGTGMRLPAIATAASYWSARIEFREDSGKVLYDALQLHLRPMHQCAAARTVPFEAVHKSRGPRAFHDEAQSAGSRSLR